MESMSKLCRLALDAAKYAGVPVDHIQPGSEAEIAAAIRKAVADGGGFVTSSTNGKPTRKREKRFWCNAVLGSEAKHPNARSCNAGEGDSELEALAIALLASSNVIIGAEWFNSEEYPATIEEAFSLVSSKAPIGGSLFA